MDHFRDNLAAQIETETANMKREMQLLYKNKLEASVAAIDMAAAEEALLAELYRQQTRFDNCLALLAEIRKNIAKCSGYAHNVGINPKELNECMDALERLEARVKCRAQSISIRPTVTWETHY